MRTGWTIATEIIDLQEEIKEINEALNEIERDGLPYRTLKALLISKETTLKTAKAIGYNSIIPTEFP